MAIDLLVQDFSPVPNGAVITPTNTVGDGLTEVNTTLTGGGVVTGTTVAGEAINGTSAKCVGISGAAAIVGWNLPATTQWGAQAVLRIPNVTVAGSCLAVRHTGGVLGQAQLGADRRMRFLYPGGTLYTTTALTLPGVFRVEMAGQSGTSTTDGKFKAWIKDGVTGAFVGGMTGSAEITAGNVGAGAQTYVNQAGKVNTIAEAQTYIVDDLKMLLGAYAFPSGVTDLPPSADAGNDQTVEPWESVQLNGGASADSGGLALTYTWTQVSGPAITLVGASTVAPQFVAPASLTQQAVVLQLIVSNGTLTSVGDLLTVTVLAATERLVTATGEVPLRRMRVISATGSGQPALLAPDATLSAPTISGATFKARTLVDAPIAPTTVEFEWGSKADEGVLPFRGSHAATFLSGQTWEQTDSINTVEYQASLADALNDATVQANTICDVWFDVRAKATFPNGSVQYSPYTRALGNNDSFIGTTPVWNPAKLWRSDHSSAAALWNTTRQTQTTGVNAVAAGGTVTYQQNGNNYGKEPAAGGATHVPDPDATNSYGHVVFPGNVVFADIPTGYDTATAGTVSTFSGGTYGASGDQPTTGNPRWQISTPVRYVEGELAYAGFAFRADPAMPQANNLGGNGTHWSASQVYGSANGGNDNWSLAFMLDCNGKVSTEHGDANPDHLQIWGNRFNPWERGKLFDMPIYRGQWVSFVWGIGFSSDPTKGWLEIWTARPDVNGGALTQYVFPNGMNRLPLATQAKLSDGTPFHFHLYRSGTWPTPNRVRGHFYGMRTGPTAASVDPATYAPSGAGATGLAADPDLRLLLHTDTALGSAALGSAVASLVPSYGSLASTVSLTQSVAGNQPTVGATLLNGKKVVAHDASLLQFINGGFPTTITGATTHFLVYKVAPISATRHLLSSIASTVYRGVGISSTNKMQAIAGGTPTNVPGTVNAADVWKVIAVVIDPAAGTGKVFDNQTTSPISGALSTDTTLNAVASMRLGRNSGSSGSYLTFSWAAVGLVERAMSDADVGAAMTELATTYGLTLTP